MRLTGQISACHDNALKLAGLEVVWGEGPDFTLQARHVYNTSWAESLKSLDLTYGKGRVSQILRTLKLDRR